MKKILITIFSTVAICTAILSIFLNSILGFFGFTYTTTKALQNLKSSHEILEKVKSRHNSKRVKVSKKFAKRASKKVTTAAISAATLGPIAVATALTGLEIRDYCNDKKEYFEDDKIINQRNTDFDYQQCISEAQNDSKEIYRELKDTTVSKASSAFKNISEFSEESYKDILDTTKSKWSDMKASSKSLLEKSKNLIFRKDSVEESPETLIAQPQTGENI